MYICTHTHTHTHTHTYTHTHTHTEQMEIEYFISPDDDVWPVEHKKWIDGCLDWLKDIGIYMCREVEYVTSSLVSRCVER